MIGTAKKLIHVEEIPNEICPDCQAQNRLFAKIYSKVFILKVFPFAYGKEATVECYACKRFHPFVVYLPHGIQDKVATIMGRAKHHWAGYVGYALIGFLVLFVILRQK
jgi:hypothetical protein